jgi:hypothetical protein
MCRRERYTVWVLRLRRALLVAGPDEDCHRRDMPMPRELLPLIVPSDDSRHEALEAFVSGLLAHTGVWAARRESDGVASCRVVAQSPLCVRLCGEIHAISDGLLHAFWLDLEREHADSADIEWTLRFDALVSERKARNIVHVLASPVSVEWRVTVSGRAIAEDGVLRVLPA